MGLFPLGESHVRFVAYVTPLHCITHDVMYVVARARLSEKGEKVVCQISCDKVVYV
jgi:hypothetical protein